MPTFVRATTSGRWAAVDVHDSYGNKIGEKTLAMSLETGRWSIDGRPVDVVQGLAVTFRDPEDANYFFQGQRAITIAVEPNSVVMFDNEDDAMHFVNAGLGDRMSQREIEEMFADLAREQQESGADGGSDEEGEAQESDMAMKGKGMENKAMKPAETKAPMPKGKGKGKGK